MRMYELGGNAFDAALAAVAAACVVEPVLTSLGGGGFLLARRPRADPRCTTSLCRHRNSDVRRTETEFYPVVADFGTAQQEFHIGAGSIATPGHGTRPGRHAIGYSAACRCARSSPRRSSTPPEASRSTQLQAYIFSIVAPDLPCHTGRRGAIRTARPCTGRASMFHQPQLADTLAWIAEEGDTPFYDGELGAAPGRALRGAWRSPAHRGPAKLPGHRASRLCNTVIVAIGSPPIRHRLPAAR